MVCDVVHGHRRWCIATGLQDSYFISLYLLVIIVASILFSRRATFLRRGGVLRLAWRIDGELVYDGKIPRTATAVPAAQALRLWFSSNLFGFLRRRLSGQPAGADPAATRASELEEKREELLDLQAFQRRHHSLDARRTDHHRYGRAASCC